MAAKKRKKKPDVVSGFLYKIVARRDKNGRKYYIRPDDGQKVSRDQYDAYRQSVNEFRQVYKMEDNLKAERELLKIEGQDAVKFKDEHKRHVDAVINQGIGTLLYRLEKTRDYGKNFKTFGITIGNTTVKVSRATIEKLSREALTLLYSRISAAEKKARKKAGGSSAMIIWDFYENKKGDQAILDLNKSYTSLETEEGKDTFKSQLQAIFKKNIKKLNDDEPDDQ